jgi:hypothetical protein
MLTPGEVVLNREQIGRITAKLGISNHPASLFEQATRFMGGGVVTGGGQPTAATIGIGSSRGSITVEQISVTVPAHFSDTEWAIQQGLRKARFQLMAGF